MGATMWTGAVDGDLANDANYDAAVAAIDNIVFNTANLIGNAVLPSFGTLAVGSGGSASFEDIDVTGGVFNCPVTMASNITGGVFNGAVLIHGSNTTGGTFNSTYTIDTENYVGISGGVFNGIIDDVQSTGIIRGGTFNANIQSIGTIENGVFPYSIGYSNTIYAGVFLGAVQTGDMYGGVYDGDVIATTVYGGIFTKSFSVSNSSMGCWLKSGWIKAGGLIIKGKNIANPYPYPQGENPGFGLTEIISSDVLGGGLL